MYRISDKIYDDDEFKSKKRKSAAEDYETLSK